MRQPAVLDSKMSEGGKFFSPGERFSLGLRILVKPRSPNPHRSPAAVAEIAALVWKTLSHRHQTHRRRSFDSFAPGSARNDPRRALRAIEPPQRSGRRHHFLL